MKLTGYEAIAYAEQNDLTLSKYADPTEDAREGLTVEEARKVASEDPTLIYIDARQTRQMIRYQTGEVRVIDAGRMIASEFLEQSEQDAPLSSYELDADLSHEDLRTEYVVMRQEVR